MQRHHVSLKRKRDDSNLDIAEPLKIFEWLLKFQHDAVIQQITKKIVGDKNWHLFIKDLDSVMLLLRADSKFISYYHDIVVKGQLIHGRGFNCRETMTNELEIPHNELNILKNNWAIQSSVNSWIKYRFKDYKLNDPRFGNNMNGIGIAQLNCGIKLQLETEPLLDGLMLGVITSRRHNIDLTTQLLAISANDEDSFIQGDIFVPVNDIFATPLLTVAIDCRNCPISRKLLSSADKKSIMQYYSSGELEDVEKLYVIEAHPERSRI